MDLFMKPLNSQYKSGECCAATNAGLRHDKCVNYFHPIMQRDAVRNQSVTPWALLQDDGVMQTHLIKMWHLAMSWKNSTFRGESSQNPFRIMGLEYDNSIFLPHISHGFPFAYHVSLIVLCHFPLFKRFCPDVPPIGHQDHLSITKPIPWIFSLLAMNNAYMHSDSGNLLLYRWNYAIVNFKLKYHGKLLSKYIFVVCKW